MRKILLILLFTFPIFITAQVSIKDTVINWRTFNFLLNADNTIKQNTSTPYDTVSVTFHGYVLENEFLKIILVPEYGGRILSMIYKPTGHEELYQNPVGAPYGINQGWFYYNWLMVYGGIFPTLSEPEHGKAWFLPWKFEIIKNTSDTVRCNMTWRDTVMPQSTYSQSFKYGLTNIKCDFTLTLVKGASALEADIALLNDADVSMDYEYWTCLTLAPGSLPGNPQTTSGAEIISSTKTVKIPSWYPDIAKQEKRIAVPGQTGIYTFSKLRQWTNWTNDGIAYAWDEKKANYWGVINHDNEEGIIRVSNNNITPGLKMWAWGYNQSQNIGDPFTNPAMVRRPYVELWAGHSAEFFAPAHFEKKSVKKWKEIYTPTVGLSNVTSASNEIIAELKINDLQDGKAARVNFATTRPNKNYKITFEIIGQNPQMLLSENVVPDPKNGNSINVALPANQVWTSGDSLICTITNSDEENYLASSISLNGLSTDVAGQQNIPNEFSLEQNYPNPFNPETTISFSIPKSDFVELKVYNVLGKEVATLANEFMNAGRYKVTLNALNYQLSSGVYFYSLHTNGNTQTRKLTLIK